MTIYIDYTKYSKWLAYGHGNDETINVNHS